MTRKKKPGSPSNVNAPTKAASLPKAAGMSARNSTFSAKIPKPVINRSKTQQPPIAKRYENRRFSPIAAYYRLLPPNREFCQKRAGNLLARSAFVPSILDASALRGEAWRVAILVFSLLVLRCAQDAGAAEHWAFQRVRPMEAPAVRNASWVNTPIDRFILAKIESAGIEPSAPASREQLIRRVSLGLIGLPPTPAEVEAFKEDDSADAFERVIDRLLGSPHYGERWARHWLDLARYAESDGFEHDAVRPHSWRYRDYVIGAFNDDKPYDRFIREQLAGDELSPGEPQALIATGFNLLGPDMVDSADQIQRRLNTLNDMTDAAASVFLGLTLGCARCHDHKSEPFTQRDYFSMQAFFAPAEFRREQAVPSAAERAAHEIAKADYDARTRSQHKQIEEIEAPYREKLFDEKLAKLSEDVQLAHRTPPERRTMEQEGTVQETAPQVKVTDAEVTEALSKEDRARRAKLEAELRKVPKPAPLPVAMTLQNRKGATPKTLILARGDYNNPREEVQPGFPAVLVRFPSQPQRHRGTEGEADKSVRDTRGGTEAGPERSVRATRRTALAEWIASEENPLTARVMVNRIWQHHFSRGLVGTASDFGTRGQAPTHPELLDWLAGEFVRGGWSVKGMHKLILLSATYQQSSAANPETLKRDPDNRLFSRQNRARLEGEVIRDSLLAISGRLNRQMGGPGVSPPIPSDITKTARNWTTSTNLADHHRRSIYVFARRNLRFPFLEVFDAPDSNLSCPERGRSTTAPQSLTLLNSEEVMSAARATARIIKNKDASEAAAYEDDRIDLAFRLILGRRPGAQELSMAREFVRKANHGGTEAQREARTGVSALREGGEDHDYGELCRALFNLNAFVYAE
jgi:hypothetical protein